MDIKKIENEVDELIEYCQGKEFHYWEEIYNKKKKSYLSKKEAQIAKGEYENILNRLGYLKTLFE